MNKQYGLYIHIPFCKSKCYYCDFYSVVADSDVITNFVYAIEQEIILLHSKYDLSFPEIVTLYIGGGTPSLLNEKQIVLLFDIISKYYNFDNLYEVSIEVNPESFTKSWIKTVKDIVNSLNNIVKLRISLGVQSFNNRILRLLGRLHSNNEVYNAVKILKEAGVYNHNFDLIFGCPQQTLEDVEQDIQQAVMLTPTHISCYALSVEEGTKLYQQNFVPNNDLQAEMYDKISKLLEKNGYRCYEISNFAKPNFECLHNLNYWKYKEYIGLGPSSVSFINQRRIKNISDVESYIKNEYNYSTENISKEIAEKEQIMLLLRTNIGISKTNPLVDKYKEVFSNLLSKGLLIEDGYYIKIPPQLRFVSNSIILEFI